MNPHKSIKIARNVVAGKIKNCRTLLRRNDPEISKDLLDLMAKLIREAQEAKSSESLLGIEGAAAEAYFSRFENLLKAEKNRLFL